MAGYEDEEVGFEEGMAWLPSQIKHEAIWETKVSLDDQKHFDHHRDHHIFTIIISVLGSIH